MKPHAIFLDIDGTLVYHNQISNALKDAISTCRKNGHYVFLCTGRSLMGSRQIPPIELDGGIISAGGYIEVRQKILHHSHISHQQVKYAISLFEKYNLLFVLEGDLGSFIDLERADPFFKMIVDSQDNSEWERMREEIVSSMNFKTIAHFKENPIGIQTIVFYVPNIDLVKELQKAFSDYFDFIIHGEENGIYNCEINRKSATKGKGIQMVLDYLSIPVERSIGFGDGMNDLSMIQTCGRGVAMGNANPELKEVADSICESVQDDGIVKELMRLNLL